MPEDGSDRQIASVAGVQQGHALLDEVLRVREPSDFPAELTGRFEDHVGDHYFPEEVRLAST